VRATWRPLSVWPHPPRRRLSGVRFRSSWDEALSLLEEEVASLKGSDVLIGFVGTEDQVGFSGNLKAGGRSRFVHRGIEISFEVPGRGRLIFQTDAFDDVRQNLRAIGLGLTALRAVERYGITSTAEQYAGFAQLAAGGPDPVRGKALVESAGSLKEALRRSHPDQGGRQADFVDVVAFRDSRVPA
jgi:hypothetical protein